MNLIIKSKYKDDKVIDILRDEMKIYLSADCGGRGSCGKCRIKFFDMDEAPEPTDAERELLSEQELEDGFRLACKARINGEADIMIPEGSLISYDEAEDKEVPDVVAPLPSEIVAVDYGTTVISGALVDLNKGIVAEAATINHQKAYGADVISRISAANEGHGEELRHIAYDDLEELSARLGRDPSKVRYIISGNTVMEHILSGFSLKGMAGAPYTPVDVSMRRDGNMTLLPCVSAFVGADIVSGICASSLDTTERPWIYVDLGTNGEMALGASGDAIVCSAPAGPAFEGAGLRYGMPAVAGAVTGVTMIGKKVIPDVLGGAEPAGISGSGAVDLMACLLRGKIMDETGKLDDDYLGNGPSDGFPVTGDVLFTQKDVREVQKAKAAIRAGIETLINESGIPRKEIDKFVIAGNFGTGLNISNAAAIGLIPEDMTGVVAASGNASLTGATLYALDTGFGARLNAFSEHAREIVLSETKGFDTEYLKRMNM